VSVGKIQWHGNRAKALLKSIIIDMMKSNLYAEILSDTDWSKRSVNEEETKTLQFLLTSNEGKEAQDRQAIKDVQTYLLHANSFDITNENMLIFLADIENQGGANASSRIIKNTLSKYGKMFTWEDLLDVTLNDSVFKKYRQRRLEVYKTLTGNDYPATTKPATTCGTYVVKEGENLTIIAKRFGTTVQRLVEDNKIPDPDIIRAGQIIKFYK
jgi:LysM repeat protein